MSDFTKDDKDNILPILNKKAQLRLKKQLARELNAAKTKADSTEPVSANDITKATVFDAIKFSPAKHVALNAQRYRASRKIEASKKTTGIIAVCAETGVNMEVNIPRIPGFYLSYVSPLSDVENCRKLAQRGYGYLIQLDTQILAGILLILADDYNLFQFSPSANGFTKNAILRSCGKIELINAILLIEEKIHSQNYAFLPRLSFLQSLDTKQGEYESNLQQWCKLLVSTLQAPLDTTEYVDTVEKRAFPYIRNKDAAKAEAQAKRLAKQEERKLKSQLETAAKYAKDLFKDGLISQTLKNYIVRTFDPITFQTVDASFKSKLVLKLIELEETSKVTFIIKALENKVKTIDLDSIDILEAPAKPAPVVPLKTIEQLTNYDPDFDEVPTKNESAEIEQLTLAEGEIAIEYHGKQYAVNATLWNSLSVLQQIMYKKKLEK